jgi:hypothetical protein
MLVDKTSNEGLISRQRTMGNENRPAKAKPTLSLVDETSDELVIKDPASCRKQRL